MIVMQKMVNGRVLAAAMVAAALPAGHAPASAAATQSTPDQSAGEAAAAFLDAFTRLDQARFDSMWSSDATLFFPGEVPGHGAGRITGRDAVLDTFHRFFAAVRRSREGPDYLGISPKNLLVQDYGDVAVVTFTLGGAARRTAVLRQEGGRWLVAHLHASNIEIEPPSPDETVATSPQLAARADELVRMINGEVDLDAVLAQSFLAETPAAEMNERILRVRNRFGRATGVDRIAATSSTEAMVILDLERAKLRFQIAIEPNAPHRIETLTTTGVDSKEE